MKALIKLTPTAAHTRALGIKPDEIDHAEEKVQESTGKAFTVVHMIDGRTRHRVTETIEQITDMIEMSGVPKLLIRKRGGIVQSIRANQQIRVTEFDDDVRQSPGEANRDWEKVASDYPRLLE